MKTTITESIWSIGDREPLMKAIIKHEGNTITRRLNILGHSSYRNEKIDVVRIRMSSLTLEEIDSLNIKEIDMRLKELGESAYKHNVDNEIACFKYPIVTREI